MSSYMQYEHDSGIIARWSGGAYIDLGYIDERGEFHAGDVINVYDYAKGEPEISTLEEMAREVDERLRTCEDCGEMDCDAEERDDYDDEYLCDDCHARRVEADEETEVEA